MWGRRKPGMAHMGYYTASHPPGQYIKGTGAPPYFSNITPMRHQRRQRVRTIYYPPLSQSNLLVILFLLAPLVSPIAAITTSSPTRTSPMGHPTTGNIPISPPVCTNTMLLPSIFALGALGFAGLATPKPLEYRSLASDCANLATTLTTTLSNTTVWFTSALEANNILSLPDNDPSCGIAEQTIPVDLCRVAMQVTTSPTSAISLEAWLPADWTGRFLSTGNGGLAGCIQYGDLAYATRLGFAAVGANNGHNGTSGLPFLDSPEVVEDFAYRSVHTGVVVGKQVAEAFYGSPHDKSYYLGCSTGGRQGFKSAQDFPDDFDGILAGAPAFAFNNLSSWSGNFYLLTGAPGDETYLDFDQWGTVHEDVLAQCDSLDGAVDGVLEDPGMCVYEPAGLVCVEGAPEEGCLTETQADTVRKVLEPLYGEDGSLVYPGMQPGAEELAKYVYYAGVPFQYTSDWFRYAIYNDAQWDPATLGPADYAAAAEKNPGGIETWEGDLSGVREGGSKILHYHGLMDAIISSENSPRYYEHVRETMGLAEEEMDEFYRFFRISGMAHCSGGDGAFAIGNGGGGWYTDEPEGNVLMALVKWVEEGEAPETVTGAMLDLETEEAVYERRHCRYPRRNELTGEDSTNPDDWECVSE